MALRRPQAGRGEGFDELAALWVEGLSRAHDPGCGCGGLFAPVLQADMVETDLTDYLIARYRGQGRPELVGLIEGRKAAAAARPFEGWIASLADAELQPEDRERIEADLRIFLESLSGQAGRNIGICT